MKEKDLKHGSANRIDHPEDWRMTEYLMGVVGMRDRIDEAKLPPWLSFAGPDWFAIRLVIDGVPRGPSMTWPNALFVSWWLSQ